MKNFHILSKVERRAFPGARTTYSEPPFLPRSEVIWLTSRDSHGNWITGVYAEGDPARKQCLIHFYGGGENLGRMEPLIETCRSQGLAVLIFDYRGYGSSGGRPREASFYVDAELIYDWLVERRPGTQVLVSGRALGAAVAVHLARRREISGLILFSPFSNMMDVVSDIFPRDEIVIEDAMPFSFDNVEVIRKVRCPIMIVRGAEDATVSQEMTRELELAVKTSLTRLDVPDAGHDDLLERHGETVWPAVFEFIDTCGRKTD